MFSENKGYLSIVLVLLLVVSLSGCVSNEATVSRGEDTVTNTDLEVEWKRVNQGCWTGDSGCISTDPLGVETENDYVYFSYSNSTPPYYWLSVFDGDGNMLNKISPTDDWGREHDIDSNFIYGIGDNDWWRYDLDCLKSGSTGCGDAVFENVLDRDVFEVEGWGYGVPIHWQSEQEALENYCHGDPYDMSYDFSESDCGFYRCYVDGGRDIKSNNEQYIGISYSCDFWNGSYHDTEYCFKYLLQLDDSMSNYTWYIKDSDYCTFPNEPDISISDTDRTMVSDVYFSNNYAAITSDGDKLWEIDNMPQSVVFDGTEYMYTQDGDYLKRIKPSSGNVKWKMNITAPKLNLTGGDPEDPWGPPNPDEFSYPCSFIEVGPWGETYILCKRNNNVANSNERLYIVVINKFGELVSSNSYGNWVFMHHLSGNAEVSKNGDLLMSRRGLDEGEKVLYSFTQNQTISTVSEQEFGLFDWLNIPFGFLLSPFTLFLIYVALAIALAVVLGYYINGLIASVMVLMLTLVFTIKVWIPPWMGIMIIILIVGGLMYLRKYFFEGV